MICKHCAAEKINENSLRNHERLCPLNPTRVYVSHTKGKPSWNKGTVGDPRCSKKGKIAGHPHTAETKQRLSLIAKERKLGGYREGAGTSKKFYVSDSFGKQVCLQSSFELRCAELLTELSVRWIRPKPLNYDGRRYYPDFYLVDFDLYLDPKNNYLAVIDKPKIDAVMEQNNVEVLIILDQQLNKASFVAFVAQWQSTRLITERRRSDS